MAKRKPKVVASPESKTDKVGKPSGELSEKALDDVVGGFIWFAGRGNGDPNGNRKRPPSLNGN